MEREQEGRSTEGDLPHIENTKRKVKRPTLVDLLSEWPGVRWLVWRLPDERILGELEILRTPGISRRVRSLRGEELRQWVDGHPKTAERYRGGLERYCEDVGWAAQRLRNNRDLRDRLRFLLDYWDAEADARARSKRSNL